MISGVRACFGTRGAHPRIGTDAEARETRVQAAAAVAVWEQARPRPPRASQGRAASWVAKGGGVGPCGRTCGLAGLLGCAGREAS